MLLKSNHKVIFPVFIVHWNRPEECLRAVNSFISQTLPIEITIIDNSSKVDNIVLLKEQLPTGVNLVCLEDNKGWGGGFNLILREWLNREDLPYCFISSHDTILHSGCLEEINSMHGK